MSKKLVINADDFGLNRAINDGIMRCRKNGTITDISALSVGEAFSHAVESAKKDGVKTLGVHLALTGGLRPCSPKNEVLSLIGKNGTFPRYYWTFIGRYYAGSIKKPEIITEFRNQIARVKKEGFEVTHLDSHHHIHVLPGILKIVIQLMKEEGISYVRYPLERAGIFPILFHPRACARNMMLSSICRLSRSLLENSGVQYNDFFIGHARAFRFSKEELVRAAGELKNGLTELSCHPGYGEEDREKEVSVLCHTDFVNSIKRNEIELVSY